jgi:hypothetical protein
MNAAGCRGFKGRPVTIDPAAIRELYAQGMGKTAIALTAVASARRSTTA